jgi:hypothetical protein
MWVNFVNSGSRRRKRFKLISVTQIWTENRTVDRVPSVLTAGSPPLPFGASARRTRWGSRRGSPSFCAVCFNSEVRSVLSLLTDHVQSNDNYRLSTCQRRNLLTCSYSRGTVHVGHIAGRPLAQWLGSFSPNLEAAKNSAVFPDLARNAPNLVQIFYGLAETTVDVWGG